MLVAARAVQGVFAALLGPTDLAAINVVFTRRRERDRIFAVFGATAGLGAAVGLLLGGSLTDWLSWRWALHVNLLPAGASLLIGNRRSRAALEPGRGLLVHEHRPQQIGASFGVALLSQIVAICAVVMLVGAVLVRRRIAPKSLGRVSSDSMRW